MITVGLASSTLCLVSDHRIYYNILHQQKLKMYKKHKPRLKPSILQHSALKLSYNATSVHVLTIADNIKDIDMFQFTFHCAWLSLCKLALQLTQSLKVAVGNSC